jgi:alpha-D-xyloside xylohydrolase
MKQGTDFMTEMADMDLYPDSIIWRAGSPLSVAKGTRGIEMDVPFHPFEMKAGLTACEGLKAEVRRIFLELLGSSILRFTTFPGKAESPMLDSSSDLAVDVLEVQEEPGGWKILDSGERLVAYFKKKADPVSGWSNLIPPSVDSLSGIFFPGESGVSLSAHDQFFPGKVESLPLAYIEYRTGYEVKRASLFSFAVTHDEHFAGTGERFSCMDLRGQTLVLENTDGLGVNSRRTYKNVPFYLSSRGYGLFIHSSSHMRLSLADVSTRAVQARIEDDGVDLFIISGGSPERVLYNYRRLTGFPPELPLWSYGTWMSRMTYFSAGEIEEITGKLRREEYPCDVIHIDTGWFEKDWVCEWKFSPERFPDPPGFMKRLKDNGFRVSLWQTPNIGEGNCLLDEARSRRYLAPPGTKRVSTASDFSGQDFGGQIDFTNPEAVDWYREKIRGLLKMGAAAIKTDFGEKIQADADYLNMSAEKLHNLYGLLYQKTAFEETLKTTGEGIIWARAGWAGCQRYPVHWGGDAASSWDGMAATLKGGLHLGLSGFGYWSHDVPGFHGLPEFMNSSPDDNLYIRWTQMGVFSSHLRYHGTSAREPWHFPKIAPLIRQWLNLRYKLIPYFLEQAKKGLTTGYPILRAMLMHFPDDPACWHIDDQFFCGDSFLVCPVMNDSGVRNVYLPRGEWVDFWTGERHSGEKWIKNLKSALELLPVYCPAGSRIPVYPEKVQSTDQMMSDKTVILEIDASFNGVKMTSQ